MKKIITIRSGIAATALMTVASFLTANAAAMPQESGRDREAGRQGDGDIRFGNGGAPSRFQNGGSGNTASGDELNGQLQVYLSTDRTQYSSNRAVQIGLAIVNRQHDRISVATGRRAEYDFQVRDSRTGALVWSLSQNRGTPTGPASFTLLRGERRTHQQLWGQTDNAGRRVAPGVYTVEAVLWSGKRLSTSVYIAGNGPNRPDNDNDGGRPRPDRPDYGRPGRPGRPDQDNGAPLPDNRFNLSSTLTSDRLRVSAGDAVRLTFTVSNPTSQSQALSFSSAKRFDMVAIGPSGNTVWQQSRGMMYGMALSTLELRPGDQRTFTGGWRVEPGTPPGLYTVYAFLTPITGSQGGGIGSAGGSRNTGVALATFRLTVGGGSNGGGGGSRPGRHASLSEFKGINPDALLGERITVSGTYLGQKGGFGSPPVSRSDWVLAGEGITLYVSGPMPDQSIGQTTTVTATVRRSSDGRLYLEAR